MDLGDSGAREFSVPLESKVRDKQAHQFFPLYPLFRVNECGQNNRGQKKIMNVAKTTVAKEKIYIYTYIDICFYIR